MRWMTELASLRPLSLFVLSIVVTIAGCQTPFITLPGGQLKGIEVTATSFASASKFSLMQLEVRPVQPYSVWLRVSVINDRLYIDAAENRRWHDYLKEDSHVRIKLGDKIYRATAVQVTDEEIIKDFISGRSIYHLTPASELE